MQSNILSKRELLIVVFIELAIFTALVFCFVPSRLHFDSSIGKQIQNDSALVVEQEQARAGLPVRLKIPKINVDAAVEYAGITSDGAMDVPTNTDNVAWFNLGPRPGENGSAVIAGHYGIKNGKASVFDNLYKLRKGDKLFIEDDKGVIAFFVVREIRRYDPKADASDVFSSSDGKAHLNFVTCEGEWDKVSKSYPVRLVVFTDKE